MPTLARPAEESPKRSSGQPATPLALFTLVPVGEEGAGIDRNIGLAEAFLRGGVANYVGTHWEVSDDAAPAFMEAFYGTLLRRETIGRAVSNGRQAVLKVKSRDWADYIHYGNPAFVLKMQTGETPR